MKFSESLFCSRFWRAEFARHAAVLALLATTGAIAAPALAAQGSAMELDDLSRIVRPLHPSISPSGEHVALVAMRANLAENGYEASLVLVDLATGTEKELTPERPRVADPHWSPSGDRLAFLDAGDGGAPQLYVLSMDGGEARRLTEGDQGILSYRWSPDGRTIAFRRKDEVKEPEGEERHNRSFEVGSNSFLTGAAPIPTHLWRVPADGGEAVRLTEGEESVDGFEWDPAGDAFLLEVQPSAHSGSDMRTSLQLLDADTGERRTLVTEESFPYGTQFSPDGSQISYLAPRGSVPGFTADGMFVLPRTGGEARDLTADIDRDLNTTLWLPDGSGMLVRGPDLTTQSLWLQPLDGPARRLDLGEVEPLSDLFSSDGGRIAFAGSEPHRPPELYVMEAPEWTPRRITSYNDEVAARSMGQVESLAWEGPDGFDMTGVLIYPPDYQEDREYPLVLLIHGGPMGTSTDGFHPMGQIFAAEDWLVFMPNYRGSNNQGTEFQRAVVNDAGDGPARDIMSGVEMLKARGIVDESRVAVSGWSYGGFMTAWLTAHYDGWAAAVAGAPPTDWLDAYAASDLNTWFGFGLGGSPWLNDNAENYRLQSPITYAHRIRTPTLILSTTGDERVPVSHSYKLFHALRDNGAEVEFVAYPVGGHFPSDPVHQRDVHRRWIDWIDMHFDEVHAAGVN